MLSGRQTAGGCSAHSRPRPQGRTPEALLMPPPLTQRRTGPHYCARLHETACTRHRPREAGTWGNRDPQMVGAEAWSQQTRESGSMSAGHPARASGIRVGVPGHVAPGVQGQASTPSAPSPAPPGGSVGNSPVTPATAGGCDTAVTQQFWFCCVQSRAAVSAQRCSPRQPTGQPLSPGAGTPAARHPRTPTSANPTEAETG